MTSARLILLRTLREQIYRLCRIYSGIFKVVNYKSVLRVKVILPKHFKNILHFVLHC